MLHTLFQETLQQIEIDIGIFNERKKYLKDILHEEMDIT